MKYAKPEWRDGQPYSPEYDDVYFSRTGGVEETEHVFIQHNNLPERFQQNTREQFVIAETGFGSGLNFLITVKHWLALSDASQTLHFYSIEKTPFRREDLARAQQAWPELAEIALVLQQQYTLPGYGFHRFDLFGGRVRLTLMVGDIDTMLQQASFRADAWMLDGFAPGRNPQMWSEAVFAQMARLSRPGASFSTYTAAGAVRRGLLEAGFEVEKVSGFGSKRDMLRGVYRGESSPGGDQSQPWFACPEPSEKPHKVCIIGAGIAGLSTAWSLMKRGIDVELIDAGEAPGAQASGNPRGMIMPRLSLQDSADGEFYLSAFLYSLRCLQQLDPDQQCWQQTGGLQLPSGQRTAKQIDIFPQDEALAVAVDAARASELSGITIETVAHYYPEAACVYPRRLLELLIQQQLPGKLTLRFNCLVDAIEYDAQRQQWTLKDPQQHILVETGCLVIAAAWQSRRFTPLNYLHLQPARGQLSLLQANMRSEALRMPVSFEGYLMPATDHEHVAGASFELDDCCSELRDKEHRANIEDVNRYLHLAFDENSLRGGRASVRAVTPDRTPAVGPVPDVSAYQQDYADLYKGRAASVYSSGRYLPGLYLNSGHGARGFSSAFLCAELLAAIICAESLPVSNRVRYALHPARFLIRSLKKKRS